VLTSKTSSDQNSTFAIELTVLFEDAKGREKIRALSSVTAAFAEKASPSKSPCHISRSDCGSTKTLAKVRYLHQFSDKEAFLF